MALTESPPRTTEPDDVQVLFREARRRRRRRWLVSGIVLVVIAAVVVVVNSYRVSPGPSMARTRNPGPAAPRSVGLATGATRTLRSAGPLAVNATGSLFVVDETRHEILVRLDDGTFRVVAGDGVSGFAGDGGPATKAELSDVTDLTFGPNGDLYLADNGLVRVIDRQGVIETIVSPGTAHGLVTSGASPGSAAAASQITSVAVNPDNVIYAATPSQIYRLTSTDQLQPVAAVGETIDAAGTGQAPATIRGFGQIAVDSRGDIYASSDDIGWSVYRITPEGTATYLGAARGSGGTTADVELGPGDTGYAGDGGTVVRASGDHLVPSHPFGAGRGRCCFYMKDFAFSPGGAIYADNLGESAFGLYQEILSYSNGETTVLWKHRLG
jgi:hypothetical protein